MLVYRPHVVEADPLQVGRPSRGNGSGAQIEGVVVQSAIVVIPILVAAEQTLDLLAGGAEAGREEERREEEEGGEHSGSAVQRSTKKDFNVLGGRLVKNHCERKRCALSLSILVLNNSLLHQMPKGARITGSGRRLTLNYLSFLCMIEARYPLLCNTCVSA